MWSNFKELRQELEKRKATSVGGIMRDAVTVDEDLPLSRAADLIVNKKANRLVRSVPDLLCICESPAAPPVSAALAAWLLTHVLFVCRCLFARGMYDQMTANTPNSYNGLDTRCRLCQHAFSCIAPQLGVVKGLLPPTDGALMTFCAGPGGCGHPGPPSRRAVAR